MFSSAQFFAFALDFENSVSLLRGPYSLNCCKFVFTALRFVLYTALYYRYFVTILKIIIYSNIVYMVISVFHGDVWSGCMWSFVTNRHTPINIRIRKRLRVTIHTDNRQS